MVQGGSPFRTFMVSSEQSKYSTASGRPRAACTAAACPRLRGKPSTRTMLPGGVCAIARCGREAAGPSGRLAGGDNGGELAARRQLWRPAVSRRLLPPEGQMPGVGNHTGLAEERAAYRHSGPTCRTEVVMPSGTRRPSRMISCSCAPSGESGLAASARSRSPVRVYGRFCVCDATTAA